MRTKRIFTRAIATELIKCGHDVVKCEENRKHPTTFVYTFKLTPEFEMDLIRIMAIYKTR